MTANCAQTQAQADRRFREALEERSINLARADVVGGLNRMTAGDVAQGRPGLSSYVLAMTASQGHARHVPRLNKSHDRGGFNRLHPGSTLQRAPASPTSDIPANQRDDARDQPFTPQLKAQRLADTGGMDSDGRTRADYWPETLSLEQMASLVGAMAARRFY